MGATIQKTYETWSVVWTQPPNWQDHDNDKVWSQLSTKTQVWSQPSIKESCMYSQTNPRSRNICNLSSGSWNPIDHSTNFNMRTDVLRSSMIENRLIIGQWWKSLTSMRETTNNGNGSQGTVQYNPLSVKNELKSNTCGTTQSKTNDESLSSSVKNFPLRHASSKVPKGISRSISRIMRCCRHETICRKRAMMFPPSMTRDKEQVVDGETQY